MDTTQPDLDEAIQTYYARDFDEDARITTRSVGGRVEHARVVELVSAQLRPGSRVLDVGGATGVHSRWLAAAGHTVTLVDPVPEQVARAAALGTFDARVGDARALELPDESYDAVLLFGPLYHLAARDDRLRALAEARRVLVPGGVVLAQGVSRLSAVAERLIVGGFETFTDDDVRILRTGQWHNTAGGFPGGHLHTADELRAEVTDAGFADVRVCGVEGQLSLEAYEPDEEAELLALALARRLQQLPIRARGAIALANLAGHVLAVGRR